MIGGLMGGIRCGWAWLYLAISVALTAREADALVVFSDDFESDVASISSRWGNASTGISLTTAVPSSSGGRKSLQLDAGLGGSALLYHPLPLNYSRLFYRYYVKYEGTEYHHTGGMIGGYDPPTPWPQGDAGLKGIRDNGDRLVAVSLEIPESNRLDFYNNWIDMQGATYQGLYYGRQLIQDLNIAVPNQWTCVELMVTLNTPATASNGELTVWINGDEVANFRSGTPTGYWDAAGDWRMRSGSPAFGGFRWRDTTSLGLNWVKLQNFDATTRVWFDDVVVATERIGCLPEPRCAASLGCGVILLAALARGRSGKGHASRELSKRPRIASQPLWSTSSGPDPGSSR